MFCECYESWHTVSFSLSLSLSAQERTNFFINLSKETKKQKVIKSIIFLKEIIKNLLERNQILLFGFSSLSLWELFVMLGLQPKKCAQIVGMLPLIRVLVGFDSAIGADQEDCLFRVEREEEELRESFEREDDDNLVRDLRFGCHSIFRSLTIFSIAPLSSAAKLCIFRV